MPVRNFGKSTKLRRRGRNDHDRSVFPVTKARRDEPREGQGQRDFSKTKCYNCGQMEHNKAQCQLLNDELGKI